MGGGGGGGGSAWGGGVRVDVNEELKFFGKIKKKNKKLGGGVRGVGSRGGRGVGSGGEGFWGSRWMSMKN